MQLAPQLTADVAPSAAAHRACLSCSPGRPGQVNSVSTYQQYSSYPSAPPQGSNDLWLSSRPSPHATISAAPLHVRLDRRAFPAADAVADDRRPLGVAAQAAQAGIFHGHGRRRLAREDAAAGRGRRGAHLAASPQLVRIARDGQGLRDIRARRDVRGPAHASSRGEADQVFILLASKGVRGIQDRGVHGAGESHGAGQSRDSDRQQAALQGVRQAGGPDDAHQARGRGRQGGQARRLVGQEASQEPGDGEVPACGAARGGHPPGSHAAHPRSHGIRQGSTNQHHPLLLISCVIITATATLIIE